MDTTRSMGVAVAALRTGTGLAFLVAPRRAARRWAGSDPGDGAILFTRAVGARDVAVGASTFAALGTRRDTAHALRIGCYCDLADAAATLTARELGPRRRVTVAAAIAGVGVAGLAALAWARRHDAAAEVRPLSDEIRMRIRADDEVDLRAVDRTRV